jgi:hypothetical protein
MRWVATNFVQELPYGIFVASQCCFAQVAMEA